MYKAEKSGITREALYKALRPNAQPPFGTVDVCKADLQSHRVRLKSFNL
ncbi:hypothetical protein [Methylophilus aquaticus]